MSIYNLLFKRKTKKEVEIDEVPLPQEFKSFVIKSIEIIGSGAKTMDDVFEEMISKGIPETEANELMIFIPIVFIRKLLPEVSWCAEYYDCYSEKDKVKRLYDENLRYQIIKAQTDNFWNTQFNNEYVENIVLWSSEYDAINQLLNDGGSLEDAKVTETLIMR